MKKIAFIIVIFSLFINFSSEAQTGETPNWIKGSWYNISESLSSNLVLLTFRNDSIFISKGIAAGIENENQVSLNKRYFDYKVTKISDDNTFKVKYEKSKDVIVYEFKLQNVKYSDKPVLTYSLSVNDNLKKRHSSSCDAVFERLKK